MAFPRFRPSQVALVLLSLLALALLGVIPRLASRQGHERLLAGGARGGYPVTITDSLSRTVTIPRRPERLISLAPSITEILFAIGAGERVVANTTYCNYPPEATTRPRVGGYLAPNLEKIAAMKPDLVIGDDLNGTEMIDRLTALGISVLIIAPKSIEDVLAAIPLIGSVVGASRAAEETAAAMAARRDRVAQRAAGLPAARRPRVLFLFSLDDQLYSAGPGSYIDDFISLAGGRNIAASAKSPWPCLSPEVVAAANPEVIIVLQGKMQATPVTAQSALAYFRARPRWRTVAAVQAGRIAVLDDDLVTLPGPRMVAGLELFADAISPRRKAED